MPDQIAIIEKQIETIETALSDKDLFATDPNQFNSLVDQLTKLQANKAIKEEVWLIAAEKAELLANSNNSTTN